MGLPHHHAYQMTDALQSSGGRIYLLQQQCVFTALNSVKWRRNSAVGRGILEAEVEVQVNHRSPVYQTRPGYFFIPALPNSAPIPVATSHFQDKLLGLADRLVQLQPDDWPATKLPPEFGGREQPKVRVRCSSTGLLT